MSVLAPAVGAVLAAIIESSVLTHLQAGGIRPDLVFAVGVALAMVLGFESGMTWAFVGGLSLDLLLPGRALGSTALSLVLVTGMALLVARATWPPRLVIAVLTVVRPDHRLPAAAGSRPGPHGRGHAGRIAIGDVIVCGLLNAVVTALAVVVVRALDLRFGEPERLAW